jgi:hypothetical protein
MDTPQPEHVYHLAEARPQAIIVYCGDPRFQRAFREFIGNDLHLDEGEYIPLVVSGGVASLSEPMKLPKEFKFMKERIELFLGRFDSIRRIILINHEDCRHYESLKSSLGPLFLQHLGHMTERQIRDLTLVSKTLLGLTAPGLQIELYYARIVKDGAMTVRFEKV